MKIETIEYTFIDYDNMYSVRFKNTSKNMGSLIMSIKNLTTGELLFVQEYITSIEPNQDIAKNAILRALNN